MRKRSTEYLPFSWTKGGTIRADEVLGNHDYGEWTPEGFRVGRTVDPFTGKPNPLFFPADAGLLAVAEKAALDLKLAPVKTASGERTPRIVTGVIVTGDAFVASLAKKDALRKEFKANATEMEGAAVAQICWQRRVPCLILRSLSDSAALRHRRTYSSSRRALPRTPRCSLPVLWGVSKRKPADLPVA